MTNYCLPVSNCCSAVIRFLIAFYPGLDRLTQLAGQHGALGCRLTGAGWGGCVVALVTGDKVATFLANMKRWVLILVMTITREQCAMLYNVWSYFYSHLLSRDYYGSMGLTEEQLNSAIFVTKPGAGADITEIQ